ncbi:hemolysin III family protein [Rhizobium sp. L1K21]|uniref:PAQR family membrane homeostasis protein TrhA n=1 Tax=Rhizobium sp. L1K21 TaxID=2954933 RepID=UPI0020934A3B|nr:hemolysin III family protein [Rhizobium sp. L1K21]MCO6186735.1 hemolysin III family protein [Rhizobium sp. L1K21]
MDYKKFTHFRWNYDRHEIIADGIVHGIGIVAALIGVTALIFYAFVWGSAGDVAAAWIYGIGLVGALSISFTYNIWPVSQTKWILRRFDHSAIFILIAATYTPFLMRAADDWRLIALLVFIWTSAIGGILLKFFFPGRFDRAAIALYLAMGWCGVLAAGPLWDRLATPTMVLIIVGGVIYSLGVIFHVWEKLRFQNAIWHGFVVSAAAVHYAAVFTAISLQLPLPQIS